MSIQFNLRPSLLLICIMRFQLAVTSTVAKAWVRKMTMITSTSTPVAATAIMGRAVTALEKVCFFFCLTVITVN